MRNTYLSQRLRPFVRKPNPPVQDARPVYQVNLHRRRSRPPKAERKFGLLDAAAGELGRPGRIIAGCFGIFISFVLLAFLTILGVFGYTAYHLLSNF